jgi:hypothetical protein
MLAGYAVESPELFFAMSNFRIVGIALRARWRGVAFLDRPASVADFSLVGHGGQESSSTITCGCRLSIAIRSGVWLK